MPLGPAVNIPNLVDCPRASTLKQPRRDLEAREFRMWLLEKKISVLIPWGRKWQPTLVFLPGESHGQRSLVGYSPWGHKELDMTEATCELTH